MEIDAGFEEFFEQVKAKFASVEEVNARNHMAIHVNVTDMGNRPFYIEIEDNTINVQPYGYYDNDAVINADSQIILAMINKEADLRQEYSCGRVGAFGNLYILSTLRDIIVDSF